MRTLHAQTAIPISVSAKRLLKLERTGRYDEALSLFGNEWETEDLSQRQADVSGSEQAEFRLRFGCLIGFEGYRRQLAGAQERSKDILTDARERFLKSGQAAKVAECESYIALAYWRKGEHLEAETWVETALAHELEETSDAALYALLTKSLILLSQRRDTENIDHCLRIEERFRRSNDPFFNGSLSANLGVSYRNLGYSAEAMKYFGLARSFHERSGHKTCLAIVQNNLALLLNAVGRYDEAHKAADDAIRLYKQTKDKVREASSLDSKAQIFLTEGRLQEGLDAAERSIKMLRKGAGASDLAESLYTRARLLLAAADMPSALISLVESINVTTLHNGERAAAELAADFSAEIAQVTSKPMSAVHLDGDEIELVLPPSIAHHKDYKGLWVRTAHLESAGVPRNSLVVVVSGAVKRGDLVAVSEKANGQVTCGRYDSEFGIICIERDGEEPLLFDSNDVEVLGKIVGVSSGRGGVDGKALVEPLRAS